MSAKGKARSRGRRGGGTVFYDEARGCWTGQLSLGRDPETGRRRRSPKVHADAEQECWDQLDEMRAELRRTGIVARRDTTVAVVVRDFLASPPAAWRSPITLQVNAAYGERLIAALGTTRLHRLTPSQVSGVLRGMAAQGCARSTIAGTRSLLVRAIHRAEVDGIVSRNAAQLAEMPPAPSRVSNAMTLEQVGALLGLDLSAWWRAYITVGVMTGLRPGERLGLRWEDVDLETGLLRVRQAQHRADGHGRAGLTPGPLKTEQSRRTLRLPRPVVRALKALRQEQAAERLRLGALYTDAGLVFCDNAGRPVWPHTVNRGFKALCEQAGLGRDWTPRELRHTFVSQLSQAGENLETIADLVGHANSNVTRAVYRRQLAEEIGTAAQVFDRLYGAPS